MGVKSTRNFISFNLTFSVRFNEIHVVSGSDDNHVKQWDAKTGALVRSMDHQHPVSGIQFDDSKILSCGANAVRSLCLFFV